MLNSNDAWSDKRNLEALHHAGKIFSLILSGTSSRSLGNSLCKKFRYSCQRSCHKKCKDVLNKHASHHTTPHVHEKFMLELSFHGYMDFHLTTLEVVQVTITYLSQINLASSVKRMFTTRRLSFFHCQTSRIIFHLGLSYISFNVCRLPRSEILLFRVPI